MKYKSTLAFGIATAFLPLLVSAQVSTTTPPTPVHISPLDNATLTSSLFTGADWTDVALGATSSSYYYESSQSSSTTVSGSYVTPLFASTLLASSSIATTGTPEGIYYWHVRSVDVASGSKSDWSTSSKVIVDNTAPTMPGNPVLVSSVPPITTPATTTASSTTSNGTQVWSFASSTDTLSGVLKYEYNLNSTSTWVDNALNTSLTTTLGVGTHVLRLRAIDRAGNISLVASTQFTVTASTTTSTTTPTVPASTLLNTKQCKKNGWKTFTNPTFKNQGKCVSYVEKMLRDKKKAEDKKKQEITKLQAAARKNVTKREEEVAKMVKTAKAKTQRTSTKSLWENFTKTVGLKKESVTSKKEATTTVTAPTTSTTPTQKNENRGNSEGKGNKND